MTAPDALPEPGIAPTTNLALHDRAFLGHPRGLGYLAFTEGCERFSYYSMQTLLVLYMVNYLLVPSRMAKVIGLDWGQAHLWGGLAGQPLSSAIFGTYTALVYMTPILGGLVADLWLGRRATLVLGGVVMALGHFLMAFEGSFLFALLALIVGVGLFKGNIASQVGELYEDGDLRRAMAFQIFYIAINVSVIIAPLVSGTLGEKVGWHWGFGSAGVVMVIGLAIFLYGRRYLPAPRAAQGKTPRAPWAPGDTGRLLALGLLVPVMAVALLLNQEIFNAYLVWADREFEFTFFAIRIPTSYLVGIDAAFAFTTLVGVAAFWQWWGKRHREPDELAKMVIGSAFSTLGGLCLVMAGATQGHGKIGLFWPLMFHLLNSIGFSHVLPVSLALFSRLAPKAIEGTAIGIYYLAFFLANALVGKVGGWLEVMPITQFWGLHAGACAVGLVFFWLFRQFLAPRLIGESG